MVQYIKSNRNFVKWSLKKKRLDKTEELIEICSQVKLSVEKVTYFCWSLVLLVSCFVVSFFSIIVHWPSQDFKGHLDINYIWVFISFYVNTGIGGPKKPNLPFPSVRQIFLWWVEDAASVASSKNFQKMKQLSKHSIVWSHLKANCM